MSTALLTGFPGFIGRRLVKRLLDDDPKLTVVCLVEQRMAAVAEGLAEPFEGRIQVVTGDIAAFHLGLADDDWERLTGAVEVVYHLAAIYDLAVPAEIAQKVNVDGTGNVLDFCAACSSLRRHVYVSTCYVAGTRTGTVYEHELSLGQDFKNHYEHTKFQAELWVRDRMSEIPTTILRPAIVVGDSQTGETEKFDGPYYLLRNISMVARLNRAPMFFGRGRAPFNVVPVDYVVAALAVAAGDDAWEGETLQLVDTDPLSAHDLMVELSARYGAKPPRGTLPARAVRDSLKLGPVRKAFADTPSESIAYLSHPVSFDTRRAEALLAPHGLKPPHFREYAKPVVDFFLAHEDDPAYAPKH